MKARAPALRTCPATCVSPSRPHRDLIAVFKVGLWLRWPGQYSFPEPATHALSRCAVQSLPVRRPSQATQDVLRSNFEHEGCRPVRYTGPIERKVATGTRTMCAESTLALVSGGPDLGDENLAALGTHATATVMMMVRVLMILSGIGASDRYTALMLKI